MDFTINEMLAMQTALQEKYKDIWEGVSPEVGQNKILWMIGEIGEVIDVVKKNGWEEATQNPDHRKELVEELADVLMYYNDVLLCYGITAEELKKAYTEKFQRNMTRWLERSAQLSCEVMRLEAGDTGYFKDALC